MIKNIFLPENIKSYYLFTKRVIGLEVGSVYVRATVVQYSRNSITIERYLEEKIENGTTSYQERAALAVHKTISSLGHFDEICSTISSEFILFKELRLPFLSPEKIRQVLPFEIEPLLPFKLSEATVDFIITKRSVEEKSSEILIAAIQKEQLIQHLSLFATAGVSPTIITTDLFSLYGLYLRIPEYQSLAGGIALIDIGKKGTKVAFIQEGRLRFFRYINAGAQYIVTTASKSSGIPISTIMENSIRFGLTKPDDPLYEEGINKAIDAYWHEINFTLNSFSIQTGQAQTVSKIIVCGGGSEIKGLEKFIENKTQIQTEKFKLADLFQKSSLSKKNNLHLSDSSLISLGAVIPPPETEEFNLCRNEFSQIDSMVSSKQIVTGFVLLFTFLSLWISHIIIQTSYLKNSAAQLKKESIALLQEKFTDLEGGPFDEMIENAQEKLTEKKQIVSSSKGVQFLTYLLELTNKIDSHSWGIVIERLFISDEKIVMDAQVKDIDSLKALERSLATSKLFYLVEPKEETRFSMELRFKEGEDK